MFDYHHNGGISHPMLQQHTIAHILKLGTELMALDRSRAKGRNLCDDTRLRYLIEDLGAIERMRQAWEITPLCMTNFCKQQVHNFRMNDKEIPTWHTIQTLGRNHGIFPEAKKRQASK